MIVELNHQEPAVAENIYTVFQRSYAIEAKWLKAVDFPPLKRSASAISKSETIFYGSFQNTELTGVVEIKSGPEHLHIQSLVVDPKYFRQGIAKTIMTSIFKNHPAHKYTVETGLDNFPAVQLYKSLGFMETRQWDTNHGVRKTRLEKWL